MIKKNKTKLIIASLLIMLPIMVGVLLWDSLPDELPTHWGIDGETDGFSSKPFSVFGLPAIMLALFWLCVISTDRDNKNNDQNDSLFGILIWTVPILTLFISGVSYSSALGYSIPVPDFLLILIGMLFLMIGNYMPKCKKNRTIGVRVKWTLESEGNWNLTHRFAGILWFFGGIAVFICSFIPKPFGIYFFIALVFVLAAAPVIYSYNLHKKENK